MTSTAMPARARSPGAQPAAPQPAGRALPDDERRRLAMELHDGVVQDVLAAGMAIDLCLADAPAGSAACARLEHAKRLTGTALRHLRSTLRGMLEGAAAADEELPDMLRRLKAQHPVRQLDVAVEITGSPVPLPAEARQALYQVASECVFNAAVHGGALRAVIRLGYGNGSVTLCVADDGHGQPDTLRRIIRGGVPGTGCGYHLGLTGIAARAEEMGWTLRADRSDLGGIAVRVLLPAGTGLPARTSGDGRGGSDG